MEGLATTNSKFIEGNVIRLAIFAGEETDTKQKISLIKLQSIFFIERRGREAQCFN